MMYIKKVLLQWFLNFNKRSSSANTFVTCEWPKTFTARTKFASGTVKSEIMSVQELVENLNKEKYTNLL